jgi:hypothetical protein
MYSRELPLSFEHHFSTNINLGWQKLDHYYTLTDSTPIYSAAVFLHRCMKWQWFGWAWQQKPHWQAAARLAVEELWSQGGYQPTNFNFEAPVGWLLT